ncbi:hypothetical protein [Celeribacter neptunius]|uniref:SnoaL-like domain-containing protein n=1 Tax=Celeribacter neptunius TaxID=588602 RepID=A0A1I3WC35_9RHOB|nr:hypothetical protein [Celeribacter neptunius]SFK04317.1 hypothetical protein SAMN04487991_3645 [Celeribacter neptunius]
MNEAELRAFLDDISTCFITGDFELWSARTLLPFSMVTKEGPVLLTTESELRHNFELYLEACKIMRLDEVYRRPIALEDCHDGTFIATYETELLCHGQRATEPYTSSALIHRTPEGDKMSSVMNARGHHPWTGTSPAKEGKQ